MFLPNVFSRVHLRVNTSDYHLLNRHQCELHLYAMQSITMHLLNIQMYETGNEGSVSSCECNWTCPREQRLCLKSLTRCHECNTSEGYTLKHSTATLKHIHVTFIAVHFRSILPYKQTSEACSDLFQICWAGPQLYSIVQSASGCCKQDHSYRD